MVVPREEPCDCFHSRLAVTSSVGMATTHILKASTSTITYLFEWEVEGLGPMCTSARLDSFPEEDPLPVRSGDVRPYGQLFLWFGM